jgi:Fe2+ or Zn2+ uptake regulation protein
LVEVTVNEQQNDQVRLLRDAHIKVTRIRIAILDLLGKERRHMTADEITAALKKLGVPADRVTVYRNLDRMIHEGLLIATCQPGKAMRVGACMKPASAHHHHVICERCGRVEETDGCPVQDLWDKLKQDIRASTGFTLTGHITQYLGICPDCRPAGTPD